MYCACAHGSLCPFPVKCHVTDNFAMFLATEFTLQKLASGLLTKIEKLQDVSRGFRATSLAVFRMRFFVHIENIATKNLEV